MKSDLPSVLLEAGQLLSRPENDFTCSTWNDAAEALQEIAGFLSAIRENKAFDPAALAALFAPTGVIQEVSLSGGWAARFLELAERFDQAIAVYNHEQP